jgi:hypothetical protein
LTSGGNGGIGGGGIIVITYTPPPTLTSISPPSGVQGNAVTRWTYLVTGPIMPT